MLGLDLHFEDGRIDSMQATLPLDIGRGPECGLRIKAWRVARRHARIEQRNGGLFLDDFGALSGTMVNGQRVTHYGPLCAGDEIVIGPCLIRLREVEEGSYSSVHADDRIATCRVADDPNIYGVRATDGAAPAVASISKEVRQGAEPPDSVVAGLDTLLRHRRRLHGMLLETLDLRRRDIASMSDEALHSEAMAAMRDIIAQDKDLPATVNR